jgi:hypothetical protein
MWLLNPASFSALQALPFAVAAGAVTFAVSSYCKNRIKQTMLITMVTFLLTFWVDKYIVYTFMPAHTGFMNGYSGLAAFTALIASLGAIIALRVNPDKEESTDRYGRRDKLTAKQSLQVLAATAGILFCGALVLAWFVVGLFNWSNTTARVGIANITAAPAGDKMPHTDPNHIPVLTQSQAAYFGHNFIGHGVDSTIYKTDTSDYTLQNVVHHLWWIAPLKYVNDFSQFGFVGEHVYNSPGYIAVDAESTDPKVKLRADFHIRYAPEGWYSYNLQRYLYTHGYDYGNLVDPTLEVDDNWQPYWTVTLTQPKLTVTGDTAVKALIVDAQTGKIAAYEPGNTPAWVDRIMSKDMVSDLVGDWAKYSNSGWINLTGAGQMKIAGDPELLYHSEDSCVWLVPITSNNTTDNSSTGVVIYEAHSQKGYFFQGLSGLATGQTVLSDFFGVDQNIQHYRVLSVQLYRIDGEPTWVAIYGQDREGDTASPAGIGFMDAQRPGTKAVIFSNSKDAGLAAYYDWLANHGADSGQVSQTGAASKVVKGTISRISWNVVGTTTTYYLTVKSDKHVYTATMTVNSSLPLMHAGDTVTLTYLDTQQSVEPLQTLKDETDLH